MRAHPEEEREYECSVSFTYNAESPADAGLQFVDNLAMHPGWDIEVRDTGTGRRWNVDGESGDTEHLPKIPPEQGSGTHYLSQVLHDMTKSRKAEHGDRQNLIGRRFVDPSDSGQLLMEVAGPDPLAEGYVIVTPAEAKELGIETRFWTRPASVVRPLCILHAMADVARDFMTDATDREEHLDVEGEWLDDYAALAAAIDIFACWVSDECPNEGWGLRWDELD